MPKSLALIALLASLSFSLIGCAVTETFSGDDNPDDVALVTVTDAEEYEEEVLVKRSPTAEGKDAIGYLRTEEWEKAIELHQAIVDKKPDEAQAHFIIGLHE